MQFYALRYRPRVLRDIDIETIRLAELSGDTVALDWQDKLAQQMATLSTFPQKFAVVDVDGLREKGIRMMLFRRTPSGPAWNVYYIIEEPPASKDGFVVRIKHIRHAASPLTEFDKGELLSDV
jgi:plasmid stabilization system protein ParE